MKKAIFAVLLLLLVIVVATSCFFIFGRRKKNDPTLPTQREHAELILKNLAVGMRMYSTITGGGGEMRFTGNMADIQRFVMQDAFAACSSKKPYHGFVVELTEYPLGDEFKTNFRFVAKPAAGYVGESFAIDKTEEIISLDTMEK